ncbi:MAG: lipopolysaccharide biosynthesis protein [Burkholderiales bacterium]|nr:lipopolysaccharide biosynthesis protein [Burkholderiales bacterium]
MSESSDSGLRGAVLKGAAWSVGLRWGTRLIGLASTVILARLLTPADFGLVAMAMLVVGFVDAWLSFGLDTALIQNQSATRQHYDTAWTIRIIQSLVVAGAIAAIAPLAAAYFREPRVMPVLWVLCPVLVLGALSNIGVVGFRKELAFHKEFRLQIAARLLGFFITVGAALWLRNYWALVIGLIGSYSVTCALSYAMHPFRPRLSLARVRDLWSYSQWMLVRSIGHFAEMRADEVIVGGLGSARQMGLYSIASELGRLPGSEIGAPLNQVLVPGFAKLQHHADRLAAAYLNVLGTVSAVTLPASIGLALVAREAVQVLMGRQWLDAVPLLVLLAISNAVRVGQSLSVSLFLSTGRPRMAAVFSWLSAALFVGITLPIVGEHGVRGVAAAHAISGAILMAFVYAGVSRVSGLTARGILGQLWRPIVACAVMALAVASVPGANAGVLVDLILKVAAGALSYSGTLLLLWRLAGSPDGAERFFIGRLHGLLKR